MQKNHAPEINLPQITALAQLFFTAASGKEPTAAVREAAIQQWQQVTVSPWLDKQAAHTHLYGELFFTELQSLQQSNDLIGKWKAEFSNSMTPNNADVARAFVSHCFELLLHKPRTYHDFYCMHYTLSDGHIMDFPIIHPVAVDFWTLYYTRDGLGEITLNNQPTIALKHGSVALIPPGCECEVRREHGSDHWQFDVLSFRSHPEWFELLDWAFSLATPIAMDINNTDAIGRLSSQLGELQSTPYQRGDISERLCHNIIENLLIRLRRFSELEGRLPPADLRVRKAIQYVLPRYCETLSLDDVAFHAGISASRLNSLFRQQYGTSLIKWRDRMRLQKAQELLNHTQLAIAEVANRVGYEDPLYFSRRFKKQFGFPPSQQR